jgi:hypothetical protein
MAHLVQLNVIIEKEHFQMFMTFNDTVITETQFLFNELIFKQ